MRLFIVTGRSPERLLSPNWHTGVHPYVDTIMSGHSKWSKVKHQKATTDVVKAAAFTRASRGITIAVREGGGVSDPDSNFHLRLAIEKAHEVNMPKENILRAIDKGKGVGAEAIEFVTYEGYGPHGIAVLVMCATDNKTRTVSILKNIFSTSGGSIASPGSVTYMFRRTGIITVSKMGSSFDAILDIALQSGADDVFEMQDVFELYCPLEKITAVRSALEQKGITVDNTNIIMKPVTPIGYTQEARTGIQSFLDTLEALEDVQDVYTNME